MALAREDLHKCWFVGLKAESGSAEELQGARFVRDRPGERPSDDVARWDASPPWKRRQKETADPQSGLVDTQKLDFLTGEKRILRVAFSPQTSTFARGGGLGMTAELADRRRELRRRAKAWEMLP